MARQPKAAKPIAGDAFVPGLDRLARHPRAAIALAAVHFVVMAIVGLTYHIVGDYGVETDFFWSYVPEARHVLQGTIVIEDFRGPLYPAVLALFGTMFGDMFRAGIILSTAAASAVTALTFLMLRRYVRPDAALLGAALVATGSFFVQYTYTAGTDMFFTALSLSGAYLLLRSDTRVWRDVVVAMFLFALAYLTRYNGIAAAAGVPAAILVANPYGQTRRERLITAGAAVGLFLLFIAPWGFYLLANRGSFFYNRNYLNIAYEMFAKGRVPWDQYWSTEALRYGSLSQVVFADPVLFATTVAQNAYDHLKQDLVSLLGWPAGIATAAGLLFMLRDRPGKRVAAFLILAAAWFGVLLLVFYGERLSLILLPAYALCAVWFLSLPRFNKMKLWGLVPAGGFVLILIVGLSAARSYSYNRESIASGPVELLQIATWADRNLPASERGKILVARKPHAAYLLNMEWVYFPYVQTEQDLQAALRKEKASYLLFGLMEAGMRPQFQAWLNPSRAPSFLVPVAATQAPSAVLYRVELNP